MSAVDLKKRFWQEYQTLPEPCRRGPLFLAVSGGKDSTALAHVALSLRHKLPELRFVHVNYHLRIPDSDREEKFLRQWAGRDAVPIYVKQLHPQGKPKNLQDWARRERYQFFRQMIAEAGQGVVCLAHHQGDQAETILMRLITGSGLKALGGMRVLEKNGEGVLCFRPLLEVPSSAIQIYLQAHGLRHHHDRSNDGSDYFRNRLRSKILPLLLKENPQAIESFIGLGRKSREAQESLEQLAEAWLTAQGKSGATLPRQELAALPRALRLTVLEAWLRQRVSRTRNLGKILQGLDRAPARPHRIALPEGWEVKLSPGIIRIQRAKGSFRPKGAKKDRKIKKPRKP